MAYNIFTYRRPGPANFEYSSTSTLSKQTSGGFIPRPIAGIPERLSFDNIIDGATCPPMTCRDFMKYLVYIEHCAENLQFYLWYKDYVKRFGQLPKSERALSPERTLPAISEGRVGQVPNLDKLKGCNLEKSSAQRFFQRTFASLGSRSFKEGLPGISPPGFSPGSSHSHPFDTPPRTPKVGDIAPFSSSEGAVPSLRDIKHKHVATKAFEGVDLKWQPFSIQPFREEISRIIAIYLAEGSPRELNISSKDRTTALRAIAQTTHPSALREIFVSIEHSLRLQSHPNFVRWSIGNGNPPRVAFAIFLGILCIVVGLTASLVLALSGFARGWRAMGAIGWMPGISTLFAALRGMCIVLHGLHRCHVRPWELWTDAENTEMAGPKEIFESRSTSNSYEDEPWVDKYRKRNLVCKIFDKGLWIEEPALRQIQDTIALQGLLIAAAISGVLVTIFMVVPGGHLF